MLLSHTNPHLTPGALIARLVRDGLDRYDPARPRATGGRGSVNGARTVNKPARRDTENGAAKRGARAGERCRTAERSRAG